MESEIYLIDHNANNLCGPFHQVSFASKNILLFLFLAMIISSTSINQLLFFLSIGIVSILLSGLDTSKIFKWSLYPLVFVLLFFLSQISNPTLAIITFLRAYSMILLLLLLINTTPYPLFFKPISRVSQTISNLCFLTYRFFFLFISRLSTSMEMMKVRGGRQRRTAYLRNLASLLAVTMILSFEKAERFYDVAFVRGYDGKIRTISERGKLSIKDIPVFLMIIAGFAGRFLL